ncbi:MAG: hypothetical protein R6X02_07380 [Enhygromyxa sp.]
MPFAVQEIRKLGEAGCEVYAADTFATAPGNHSRHVRKALLTPAPAENPIAYVDAVAALVEAHGITRLLPTFEEGFYLARHRDRLPQGVDLFAAQFGALARLHDKVAFTGLAAELGLRTAPSWVATSRAELEDAIQQLCSGFIARPAFSRGSLDLFTDCGPLAGAMQLADCSPTPSNPWLVQRFLVGEEQCSFAIAQHGRLVAHVAYVHPRTYENGGGIVFESITDGDMREACRRVIEATDYHGQLALDFLRTDDGLVTIECNPRATAGVAMMSASEFRAAVFDAPIARPLEVPSGRRGKIASALVREMLRDCRSIPALFRALVRGGGDLYGTLDDPLPALFQVLSYGHVLRYRVRRPEDRKRSQIMAAYFHDLRWNGEPLG